MPFLQEMRLRVCALATTAEFWRSLGLTVQERSSSAVVSFQSAESASIVLLPGKSPCCQPATGQRQGFVWIGLANFADVAQSVEALKQKGVQVRLQGQFEDVAYVAHGLDSEGFTFELLQTTMEENFRPSALPSNPLRAEPVLGQVKMNIRDPSASLAFYRDLLGMRLLSRQRVEKHSFTLFFLAYSEVEPPNPDPDAFENREWLWQRKVTQIELQHFDNTSQPVWQPADGESGLDSTVFACSKEELSAMRKRLSQAVVLSEEDTGFSVRDPDGQVVRFIHTASPNL